MRVGYSGIREGAHGSPGANQRALGASAKLNAFAYFRLARLWIPIIARVVCQKVPGAGKIIFWLELVILDLLLIVQGGVSTREKQ